MKKISERILNLFFPDCLACLACGSEALVDEHGLCEVCKQELKRVEQACVKCGKALEKEGKCRDCGKVTHAFDRCISVCQYTDSAANLVKGLKFHNRRYIAPGIAKLMEEYFLTKRCKADLIVAVPMHRKDERARGYNQSILIAKHLSDLTGIPYAQPLKKIKQTSHQVGLNRQERLLNLDGAFEAIFEEDDKGKRILLVDDVYTTGATMDACAKALKSGGAAKVYGFTFLTGKLENK